MYGKLDDITTLKKIARCCQVMRPENAPERFNLLVGTLCAETHFGDYPDLTALAGMGISQVDKGTFYWLRSKIFGDPEKLKKTESLFEYFNEVSWEHLRHNEFLAIWFAATRYWVRPEPLPETGDLHGQAEYWKKFYNSSEGKGDIDHYLRLVRHDYLNLYGNLIYE